MTAIADRSSRGGLRERPARPRDTAVVPQGRLRATVDGWALLGAGDELLFQGRGRSARIDCLRCAVALGLLALTC